MTYSNTRRAPERIMNTAASGGIIQDERILLMYSHALETWQLPGGLQEIGETIHETVEREIREELALNLLSSATTSVTSKSGAPECHDLRDILWLRKPQSPIL